MSVTSARIRQPARRGSVPAGEHERHWYFRRHHVEVIVKARDARNDAACALVADLYRPLFLIGRLHDLAHQLMVRSGSHLNGVALVRRDEMYDAGTQQPIAFVNSICPWSPLP